MQSLQQQGDTMNSTDYFIHRIAAFVRQERKQRNESQEVFAIRVGVHRNTLAKLEDGKQSAGRVGIETLVQIFRVLGMESRLYDLIQPLKPQTLADIEAEDWFAEGEPDQQGEH